jgi:hypothetical protein
MTGELWTGNDLVGNGRHLCEVLSQNLPRKTEKYQGKSQSAYPVSPLRIESIISRIKVWSIASKLAYSAFWNLMPFNHYINEQNFHIRDTWEKLHYTCANTSLINFMRRISKIVQTSNSRGRSGAPSQMNIFSISYFLRVGRDWVLLVRRPLNGLLHQPRMIDDNECGAVDGMRTGTGNRSTRRKKNLP